MKIDKIKLERQLIGVDRWFNASQFGALRDKVGTLHYYTGVGKTYTAVLIVQRLFKADPLHHVVIGVPKAQLYEDWLFTVDQHFNKKERERITVLSANEVINQQMIIKTNTFIVDELHLFASEEYIKVIDGTYIRSDNRLGLTATYEDHKGRHILYENLFPIIDEISEQDAIKNGFISAYLEYNLTVPLTPGELEEYQRFTEVISKHMNKFGGPKYAITLATNCLSGGTHKGKKYKGIGFCYAWAHKKGWSSNLNLQDPRDNKINELWNPNKIMGYAKTLMTAIRKRKELLYNSYYKTTVTVSIIEKFLNEKIIVFGQMTNYADKVNLLVNETHEGLSVAYHSNIPTQMLPSPKTGKLIKFGKTRLKKIAVEKIRSGEAKVICTASSLDTGFDVDDILIGIIGSGTQNFNQHKQRSGRVKRKRKQVADVMADDRRKLIVNLYVPNTQDEKWLRKRQSKSTNNIHWISTINDIVFNPAPKKEFDIKTI